MAEPAQFSGRAAPGAPRSPIVAAVVLIVFVALALLKPWDGPRPSVRPTGAPSPASTGLAESLTPTQTSTASRPVGDPGSFTLARPVPAEAAWSALRWRTVDPQEPLALVNRVVSWPRGYLALGGGGVAATNFWSSTDGMSWDQIQSGTGTAFWPGLSMLGAAPLGDNALWAVMEPPTLPVSTSGSAETTPLQLWSSRDGRAWTPQTTTGLPDPVELASRIVVASTGRSLVLGWSEAVAGGLRRTRLFRSTDGLAWREVAKGQLPAGFVLVDLAATPGGGVVAAGRLGRAVLAGSTPAILFSADGLGWSSVVLPGDPELPAGTRLAVVWALVPSRDGVLAIGYTADELTHEVWWRSPDGRRWSVVPSFGPVGAVPCPIGDGACADFPDGLIAGDGVRLFAMGTYGHASAWTSTDALDWQGVGNAEPDGHTPASAVVLPGGVLVSAGGGLWLGEAQAAP
jgi:hypothetical protein